MLAAHPAEAITLAHLGDNMTPHVRCVNRRTVTCDHREVLPSEQHCCRQDLYGSGPTAPPDRCVASRTWRWRCSSVQRWHSHLLRQAFNISWSLEDDGVARIGSAAPAGRVLEKETALVAGLVLMHHQCITSFVESTGTRQSGHCMTTIIDKCCEPEHLRPSK